LEAKTTEYELEYYEKYFGGVKQVKKTVENCPNCGNPFFFTHSTDHKNLNVKETACCTNCSYGKRKIVHVMN